MVMPTIVSAGIYNARIDVKHRTLTPNRKTVMFEIELPIDNGGVSYIDDENHQISENIVICAKPGQMRHTKFPFKCYYLHIIVNEGPLLDILNSLPNYIEISDTSEIKAIFVSLNEHYNNGGAEDEILMQSLILKLAYMLNSIAAGLVRKNHRPKSNNCEVIGKTVAYIKSNLSSDLSLQCLASEAKFSPIYFHKLFKKSTGKTLHEYVEEQRIKKAVDLLVSTDLTLSQIAYECGFSSQSYFNYIFKRKKGITPREYTKSVIERYMTFY